MSRTYKIRKITNVNSTDYYSITIPRDIAATFSGVGLTIEVKDNSIIFQSGCQSDVMWYK